MRRKELVKKLSPQLSLVNTVGDEGCAVLTKSGKFELDIKGIPNNELQDFFVIALHSDKSYKTLKSNIISDISTKQVDEEISHVSYIQQPSADKIDDGDIITFTIFNKVTQQLVCNGVYLLLKMPFTVIMDYPKSFVIGDSYTFDPALTPWAESVSHRLDLVLIDDEAELEFEPGIVEVIDGTLNIKALSKGRARLKLTTLVNDKIKLEKLFTVEVDVYQENDEDKDAR